MPTMTSEQMEAFLATPRHAIVGTNRRDGPPQLSPVWYLFENGRIFISILADSAKFHNLKRDPRISVCIDGCHPDGRTVIIAGTAKLLPKGAPLEEDIRWRIIRRYHKTEAQARRYARKAEAWPFVLVIVTADRVISQDFN